MKKTILFLCVVAISGILYGQDGSYDLNSYKTGDYKRKSLDFNLGSNGYFQNSMHGGKYQTFQGDLGILYNQTKNSRKIYESMTFGIKGGLDYGNKDKEVERFVNDPIFNNNEYKINKYSYALVFKRIGHHYINDNNLFVEFSPEGQFCQEIMRGRNLDGNYEDYKYKESFISTNVSAKIGIGKGRLEQVEDARQAVYILDELKKKGILLRELNTEEINEMAAVITAIKNKRQFDSRIRLIEEIETVDSLLTAKGYIDKTNSTAYFTSLYDKWMYGRAPERLAGSRISVGISPLYSFYRSKYDVERVDYGYDDKRITSLIQGSVYVDFNYEKPVNLKFQNSISASLTGTWGRQRHAESNYVNSSLFVTYKWGYYPNTRTYAGIGLSQSLGWIRYESDENNLESMTILGAEAYYYLSPQLRLFGNCDFSYNFRRYMERNQNYNDKHPWTVFSLGMTYSFF